MEGKVSPLPAERVFAGLSLSLGLGLLARPHDLKREGGGGGKSHKPQTNPHFFRAHTLEYRDAQKAGGSSCLLVATTGEGGVLCV